MKKEAGIRLSGISIFLFCIIYFSMPFLVVGEKDKKPASALVAHILHIGRRIGLLQQQLSILKTRERYALNYQRKLFGICEDLKGICWRIVIRNSNKKIGKQTSRLLSLSKILRDRSQELRRFGRNNKPKHRTSRFILITGGLFDILEQVKRVLKELSNLLIDSAGLPDRSEFKNPGNKPVNKPGSNKTHGF
ncbi:hypothetical protein ACFL35_07085 [Candidatus Riflebacteria bacterium]